MTEILQHGGGESVWTLHHSDARDTETFLSRHLDPSEYLTTTISSPPYGSVKDYGVDNQIGHGQKLQEYLSDCENVFRAIGARTAVDGSMWLVVDTLVDSTGITSELIPLPFLLAERAAAHGWILRDVITWKRDRGMPWSGRGRLRNAFEYVLHLVRTDSFQYHLQRLRDPSVSGEWWVRFPERYHPNGPAPTNVWEYSIPAQGSWPGGWGRHVCPLPLGLIERIINLSSSPGDIVFDPFAGTGGVVAKATKMGRRGLGTEIDRQHILNFTDLKNSISEHELQQTKSSERLSSPTPELLMNLRSLKRAKLICKELSELGLAEQADLLTVVVPVSCESTPDGIWQARVETLIVADIGIKERKVIKKAVADLIRTGKTRKFGVQGNVTVLSPLKSVSWMGKFSTDWWVYPDGRTWSFSDQVTRPGIKRLQELSNLAHRHSTVLAPIPIKLVAK